MNKILVLIKKDLYFNQKMYIGAFIGAIVFMTAAINGLDGDDGNYFYYLFYTCLPSMLIIPYSYHLDDNLSTRRFISTWPVTFEKILLAKYVLGILFSAAISSIALVLFNIFGDTEVLYRIALIPIAVSLVFSDVFVFIAYRWDIHVASYVCSFPVLIPMYLLLYIERKTGISGNQFTPEVLILFAAAAIIITFIVSRLTVKLVNN